MSVDHKSSAQIAEERNWRVGDVLAGSAIRDTFGKVLEGPLRIKITAIGWEQVLAVRSEGGRWTREASWNFTSREWVAE